MVLYDEEELRKQKEKSRKIKNMIIIGIVLSVVLIIALIITISYLIYNPNKITVKLNGTESTKLEDMMSVKATNEGTRMYFPIKDLAAYLGYKSNDGGYISDLENEDSCYVETENEIVIFTLDSSIIYKTEINNSEYEAIDIENPIIKQENKLYIDVYGLESAFNMSIPTMDEKSKQLNIATLDNLFTTAKSIAEKNNYEVDDTFVNQKAVLDNMIVVVDSFEKYGVIDGKAEKIIGTTYDKITYIPQKQAFLVERNGKVGIYGNNTKIEPTYDELKLIDSENELYLVKNSEGRYGVIDATGQRKIYLDYEKIGVDISNFTNNGMKSGYVLLDKLIPVQQDGNWKFFKIEATTNQDGTKTVECKDMNTKFESIGCVSKTNKTTTSNVMVLSDYNIIVVQRNEKYGFMDIDGKVALPPIYSDVYMETTSEKKSYYMVLTEKDANTNVESEKTYNVIEELEKKGYNKAIGVN